MLLCCPLHPLNITRHTHTVLVVLDDTTYPLQLRKNGQIT